MDSYKTYSDEQLVAYLRQSDNAAFHQIYEKYWDKLLYLAGKKLKDIFDAESIVQDVFLDIWERRTTLDIQDNLGGYLVVAVKYRILNLLASRERDRKYKLHSLNTLPDGDYGLINHINYQDTKSWLVKLTNTLPEKCRLAYTLRNQGLSYHEIAKRMSVSEKTVENHIGKALKTLRTGFGQYILLLIIFIVIFG